MKRFLTSHFNFEDDLRRAASNLEKAGFGGNAGTLEYYADTLKNYRPEKRYLCQACNNSSSSLKVWQRNTVNVAKQYDCCIFNRQEVEHLASRLDEYAKTQKNYPGDIRGPKWEDEERFGLRPSISVGYGATITFIPIKGDYEY